MKKIYLDCTHTYNSGLNTGIQRVVKNIVKNVQLVSNDLNVEIIPVILINKKYYTFNNFPKINDVITIKIRFKNLLKKVYKCLKKSTSIIFFNKLNYLFESPKFTIIINEIVDKFLFKVDKNKNKEVNFYDTDILVLLDSFWYNNSEVLIDLKYKKIKIINITYDLIPITNSEFCDEHLTNAFKSWYVNNSIYMDKFICISNTVKNECSNYINNILSLNINKNKFDYFYLGANLSDIKINENNVDIDYKKIFKLKNTYITVSTIEPRKNHEYILNAFEELWQKKIDVKYIIIGKIGWKVQKLIHRIKQHKEFNKRLFMFNNLDDENLLYAYKNAKALIFASYIEGFGLPIIESLHNNLQVLASNIAVHEEIGQDYISYFDLNDISSLVNLIEVNNFDKDISNFTWLSWEDSTKMLIEKVLKA